MTDERGTLPIEQGRRFPRCTQEHKNLIAQFLRIGLEIEKEELKAWRKLRRKSPTLHTDQVIAYHEKAIKTIKWLIGCNNRRKPIETEP